MKKITLLIFLVVTFLSVNAQNIYYDAITLKQYIHNGVLSIENSKTEEEVKLKKLSLENQNKLETLTRTLSEAKDAQKTILLKEKDQLTKEIEDTDAALKVIRTGKRDNVFSILTKYNLIQPSETDLPEDSLAKLINSNSVFLFDISIKGSTKAKPSDINFSKIGSAISNVGGIDVTNIVNALADVMIDHAKQELTVAFFNRFKKFADENPEFRILFPRTTSNLENLLAYKYPEMLPALRTGFLDDIRQIAFRLDNVLDLPRYKKLLRDLPEVRIAIRSINIIHELETGTSNAADVITDFASFKEWNETPDLKAAGNVIKIASFFSESIRSNDEETIWVPGRELVKVLRNDTLSRIFLEFIYQKSKTDTLHYTRSDGSEGLLHEELRKYSNDIVVIQDELREFFNLAEKVNVAYNDIKSKNDAHQSPSNDDYYTYINTSLDVISYGISWMEILGDDIQKPRTYLSLLRDANELYRNIYTKEYNQAVVNAFDLLSRIDSLIKKRDIIFVDAKSVATGAVTFSNNTLEVKKAGDQYTVLNKSSNATIATFKSLDDIVSVGGKEVFFSSTGNENNSLEKLLTFIDNVKPYALFIANIVEADTEEEIKNAIENAILPVGSSSVKKHSIFNISVQSYLGARVNMFKTAGSQNSWNETWGVIAPVGISFNWGGKGKNPASYSVFASLVDIGAIVDFKLTADPNASRDYEIKLGQIFSPGLYFVYGLPWELPVSVGIGEQYGPGIYKTGNGIQDADPEWKLNAFIAVDIPFFTLYNRARDSRKK